MGTCEHTAHRHTSCPLMDFRQIFYVAGVACEIVAWTLQGAYWARFPWDDYDVRNEVWTIEGQNYGQYNKPHGGMYSSFWWGSRMYIAAVLAIFTLLFMSASWVSRHLALLTFTSKERTRFVNVERGTALGAILFGVLSCVLYTSIFKVDKETAETAEWWGNGAVHIYIYWDNLWFQLCGYGAVIFMIASVVCFFFAKLGSVEHWTRDKPVHGFSKSPETLPK